jgi:hypothetical protein
MSDSDPLYLGFDLSTQQLKGLAVTSDLRVVYESRYDFDADSRGFGIQNGVLTNDAEHEVFAPVALWLRALDVLLSRLQESGLDFSRVRGISGAGQQHGSVYWSEEGEGALGKLNSGKTLEGNLKDAFSHPFSPNWQDASTQAECDEFDEELGGPEELARVTGSKAHHVCFLVPLSFFSLATGGKSPSFLWLRPLSPLLSSSGPCTRLSCLSRALLLFNEKFHSNITPPLLTTPHSASPAPKSSASPARTPPPTPTPRASLSSPPSSPPSSSPTSPPSTSPTSAA